MGWSSLRSDHGVVPCQDHPVCHGDPVCQGVRVTPPSPLPHARTTRCWGDPMCWSEHPQSPFSPSWSCWAALSAPNPWHFSSNLEILLFFFIEMFIFPIFSFFHPKLATEKPSQGCPSPGRVLPAAAPVCPMEHPGVERCWPRSPHPTPEFSTLRCFLRGLQSHLHGATALPTPTVSVQHSASTAGWCCLCPTAACGHVPTGSPPGLSGGLAAPGGQQVPSALPKSRGGILVWKNWGAVCWPECCWRPFGATSRSGQLTAPSLPPRYLPSSGKMGI